MGQRGEDAQAAPRACDGHVEAALSTRAAERPEAHSQPARRVLGVADAEEDLVSLVALNVLQVLHEDGSEEVKCASISG